MKGRFAVAAGAAAILLAVLFAWLRSELEKPLPSPAGDAVVTEPAPTEIDLAGLETVVDRLTAGQEHVFSVRLERHWILRVIVWQEGVDVALELESPAGKRFQVDGPNGTQGPEELIWRAETEGEHRLRLSGLSGAGTYRLDVLAQGRPTSLDMERLAAWDAFRTAEAYRDRGDDMGARRGFEQARRSFASLGQALMEARCERALGLLEMGSGKPQVARRHLLRAEALFPSKGAVWERAALHNDLGDLARRLGEPDRAEDRFRQALEEGQRPGGNLTASAISLNNLGVLHASLGQLQEAISAYRRSSELWRQLGVESRRAVLAHNIGTYYLELGRVDVGLQHLRRAHTLHRNAGSAGGQAAALTSIAWALHLAGDSPAAVGAFGQALELREAAGDVAGRAITLDRRGTVFFSMGRLENARQDFAEALRLLEGEELRGADAVNAAYVQVNLGTAESALGRPRRAAVRLRSALEHFRHFGVLTGEAATLSALARVLRQLGEPDQALRASEGALRIVESIRGQLQSRWLRSAYLAVHHETYTEHIDLLMTLHETTPDQGFAARAFLAGERARGRGLLESLVEAKAQLRAAAPELIGEERALRLQINNLEQRRLASAGSPVERAALDRELSATLLRYERLQGELLARFPEVFEAPPAVGVERIQEDLLDPDTLLLAYTLGPRRSFLWVVGRGRFSAHMLPPGKVLEDLARQLHRNLQGRQVPEVDRRIERARRELGELLLGPVFPSLTGEQLLIVADGALHYLPFAILEVTGADGAGDLLVDSHEVSYLPSVSVLGFERPRRRSGEPSILVVADPVFEASDRRIAPRHRSVEPDGPRPWERLPGSGAEAALIAEVAGPGRTRLLTGFDATRERFVGQPLEGFRVLHFATHAQLDERHPVLSGLVLSQVDERGEAQEGWLRAHELFDLRLDAELVVLSGCRTALGQELRGEGLLGLAQGFFYAGAGSILASLWNLDDDATVAFMRHFYTSWLEGGLPAATALRRAQLAMRGHPVWNEAAHWAGFVLLRREVPGSVDEALGHRDELRHPSGN